jgi:hypothetical protein
MCNCPKERALFWLAPRTSLDIVARIKIPDPARNEILVIQTTA